MADLQKLVENARKLDAGQIDIRLRKQADIMAAAGISESFITPGLHPSELKLVSDDEDPFGGNINNRNVARRIANQREKVWSNHSMPVHTGDPKKARADLEQSERINPETFVEEPDTQKPLPLPTAGSPAALRAAAEAKKASDVSKGTDSAKPAVNGPPVWTPPGK